MRSAKQQYYIEFVILAVAAFGMAYVPILHVPFSWAMTFFHEISHGIGAVLTGGSIERIVLNADGSGLCYTRGGWRFVTTFAGYSGAVIWGMLIFYIAGQSQYKARVPAILLAVLIVFSAVFYGRDIMTWAILAMILLLFVVVIKLCNTLKNARIAQLFLKFIGMYVLFDAIRAPLHLLDGRHVGDGATLQSLTFVPEIVWIVLWLLMGVAGLAILWLHGYKRKPR